ncbi:MAG: putative metalloprotease CJM1_0395 family protein [Pseudomonadota bacterium]
MISSINNFSENSRYPNAVEQSIETSRLPLRGDEDLSLQKVKKTEQSKDDSNLEQSSSNPFSSGKDGLTEEELRKVEELKKTDAEVLTHEQAHQSAAGSLSNGGASFEYETGPDGKRYAVGGEVSIDVSKVEGDPQATIAKARQIHQAALAPADPSGQDRKVAAQAAQMEIEATKELAASKNDASSSELSPALLNKTKSDNNSGSKVDFYQHIQAVSSSSYSGISMLDYYV